MPDVARVNCLRSTARSGANVVVSTTAGAAAGDAPPADAQAAAAMRSVAAPAIPARRATRFMLLRRVDRRAEIRAQRGVTADDRIPGHVGPVATALGNDLHAFRRD